MKNDGTPFFPPTLNDAFIRDGQLGVALALAAAGFKVFPCREKDDTFVGASGETVELKAKMPYVKAGDNPAVPDMGGHRAATADPDLIRRWWAKWPRAMVAMPAAENGFMVLDVDRPKDGNPADGVETLADWEARLGSLPVAPTVETPSHGRHIYFRLPDDGGPKIRNRAGIYPGIDIRTDGAIIAPYSVRADKAGATYLLMDPKDAPLPDAPRWLLDLLRQAQEPKVPPVSAPPFRAVAPVSGAGTAYGLAALDGICGTIEAAAVGTRNDTLNDEAYQAFRLVAGGQIDDGHATERLVAAGMAAGLTEIECRRTVDSARKAGLQNPKAPKDDGSGYRRRDGGRQSATPVESQNQYGSGRSAWTPPPSSDHGAVRYVDGLGDSSYAQATAPHPMAELRRGLSMETCVAHGVRYAEFWAAPGAGGTAPRLLLETGPGSLVAIDAMGDAPTERRGGIRTFNAEAAWTSDRPVFVVEEEIDALSIIDVGGKAIALGGRTGASRFLDTMQRETVRQPLVLAFGRGADGDSLTEFVRDGLARMQVPVYVYDLAGDHGGANAAMMAARSEFAEKVEAIATVIRRMELEDIGRDSAATALAGFFDRVAKTAETPCHPTGFPILDKLLDDGLYPGMYVVGAISGLGKTTFCLQIMDGIARAGNDVLIFSLEMARDELLAKSLSRITYQRDKAEFGKVVNAKTTRAVLNGKWWTAYRQEEVEAIHRAADDYAAWCGRVYIVEGVGTVGVSQVRERVRRHVEVTGRRPVVLIDYLQILAPIDPRATDKKNMDLAMVELKRISRDFAIPVVGISSFNRESYHAPVSLASFKESGGIEYSSDCLIGLQYRDMESKGNESETERRSRAEETMARVDYLSKFGSEQKIQAKVLKARNGRKGDVFFSFMPAYNHFEEDADQTSASANRFGPLEYSSGNGWTSCDGDDDADDRPRQGSLVGDGASGRGRGRGGRSRKW